MRGLKELPIRHVLNSDTVICRIGTIISLLLISCFIPASYSAPVTPDVYTSIFVSSRMISPLRGTGIILLYIDILTWKTKAYNSFSFHKNTKSLKRQFYTLAQKMTGFPAIFYICSFSYNFLIFSATCCSF